MSFSFILSPAGGSFAAERELLWIGEDVLRLERAYIDAKPADKPEIAQQLKAAKEKNRRDYAAWNQKYGAKPNAA